MWRSVGSFAVLFALSAFGEPADITGWSGVTWATPKPAAAKALQRFGVHECNQAKLACAAPAGIDVLVVDSYRFNGTAFRVELQFAPKSGLSRVTMTADNGRDAFERILSALASLYGRPGLQSEYDGDAELLHTTWMWSKTHGKVSLDSDESNGTMTVIYDVRP